MDGQPDFKAMLDSLLAGGRELTRKGEDYAARQLDVGDDPESRANLRKGILGGAVGAGVLSLLLGTRTGRQIGGTGLALGGLAALGKIAYDKWQEHQGGAASPAPTAGQLTGAAADARARLLLSAMIAAAKADGHVDAAERAVIQERLAPLGGQAAAFLFEELEKPLDPEATAAAARNPQEKAEVYAVSAMVCGSPGPGERAYLDRLGAALGLAPAVCSGIESEMNRSA